MTARPEPGSQAAIDAQDATWWTELRSTAYHLRVIVLRTDKRDGPAQFVTVRDGRDLRLHRSEVDLRAYLKGLA